MRWTVEHPVLPSLLVVPFLLVALGLGALPCLLEVLSLAVVKCCLVE